MDKKKREEMERLAADHERWDSRELGASTEHIAFVSDEEQKEIEESLGLQMISLRLSKSLIEQFKELAKLDGIGYQPLMRQVLTQYAKDNVHRLTALLSPEEAVKRGDELFSRAVKLREEIATLAPLSNERVIAESDYTLALNRAQCLFSQALHESKAQVLIQHAKLRMSQIDDLCQEELHKDHDKKYGKKKQAV